MAIENEFWNIHAKYATYKGAVTLAYDVTKQFGSAHAGKAVMESNAGEVDLVSTNSEILGKLVKVEPDGMCTVMYEGYTDLPDDGSVITYTAAANAVVGGATAGTIKIATVTEGITVVRKALAIKPDPVTSGRHLVKL